MLRKFEDMPKENAINSFNLTQGLIMKYLPTLPSLSTVKGYASDALTFVKESYQTYSPVVRQEAEELFETAKDFAGRSVIYIKAKAIENPFVAAFAANLAMFLSAKKATKVVAYPFSFLMSIKTARKIGAAVFVIAAVGANYALVNALELGAKPALLAAGAGYGVAYVIESGFRAYEKKQESERNKWITKVSRLLANKTTESIAVRFSLPMLKKMHQELSRPLTNAEQDLLRVRRG